MAGPSTQPDLSVVLPAREPEVVPSTTTYFSSILNVIKQVSVEPVVLAVFWAQTLSDAVLTELYLKRTCEITLGYNETICNALGTRTEEGILAESLVQPTTAYYLLIKSIIASAVPAFLSLFLGAWSDVNGRKPILLCSVIGCCLMYIINGVLASLPHIQPIYLLFGVVPLAVLGGYVNMISIAYSYISDVSSESQRSLRLAILETFLVLGIVGGLFCSSQLYELGQHFGFPYQTVFGTSAVLCLLALIYLGFWVKERIEVSPNAPGFRGIVNLSLPKSMFRACVRPRPNGKRTVIFLGTYCLVACTFIMQGENHISFLFTRLQFQWSLEDFTDFSGIFMSVNSFGTLVACGILPRFMEVSDSVTALLGFVTNTIQAIITVVARQSAVFYAAAAFGLLRGVIGPTIRSIISKSVHGGDIGKIFALVASAEAVVPLAAGPAYTYVYNNTIPVFAGASFIMSTVIYVSGAVVVGIIYIILRRYRAEDISSRSSPDSVISNTDHDDLLAPRQ